MAHLPFIGVLLVIAIRGGPGVGQDGLKLGAGHLHGCARVIEPLPVLCRINRWCVPLQPRPPQVGSAITGLVIECKRLHFPSSYHVATVRQKPAGQKRQKKGPRVATDFVIGNGFRPTYTLFSDDVVEERREGCSPLVPRPAPRPGGGMSAWSAAPACDRARGPAPDQAPEAPAAAAASALAGAPTARSLSTSADCASAPVLEGSRSQSPAAHALSFGIQGIRLIALLCTPFQNIHLPTKQVCT